MDNYRAKCHRKTGLFAILPILPILPYFQNLHIKTTYLEKKKFRKISIFRETAAFQSFDMIYLKRVISRELLVVGTSMTHQNDPNHRYYMTFLRYVCTSGNRKCPKKAKRVFVVVWGCCCCYCYCYCYCYYCFDHQDHQISLL